MTLSRRTFLQGSLATPAVVLTPGLLMPVRALELPTDDLLTSEQLEDIIRASLKRASAEFVQAIENYARVDLSSSRIKQLSG